MRSLIVPLIILLVPVFGFSQTTWYVPDDYPTIQGAIDAAVNGDTVLVRPGTYVENIDFKGKAITVTSELGADVTVIDGNQVGSVVTCQSGEGTDSVLHGFSITNGVGYGAGMYNYESSPTITDCNFVTNFGHFKGGGMYNFVSNPTVTNCTFSGNSVSGPLSDGGGGMHNESSNPTVTNCTFSGNSAGYRSGGGMYNYDSSPTVTNCTFSGNTISYDGGGGGGMYNDSSNPTVTYCTFTGNSAKSGGGMDNWESSPMVTNCTFSGNTTSYYDGGGGGMRSIGNSSPTVTNCVFSDNYAGLTGGGMVMGYYGSPTIKNCLFLENEASYRGGGMTISNYTSVTNCAFVRNTSGGGGGIHISYHGAATVTGCTLFENNGTYGGGAILLSDDGSATVTNSILWNDTPGEIYVGIYSIAVVTYSDVQGGHSGSGNIDADPLLVDAANNDFHLTFNSPCIDAGDNGAPIIPGEDFEGDIRIFDGDSDGLAVVDMGVDELIGLNVPTVYPTIQDAIYSASNGDNVLVAAGTYKENIDFLGKAIHVAGLGGPESTSIDGNQVGSVAVFTSGEGPGSILEGFTLTNGMAAEGGGVFCYNASPTLKKNKIMGNTVTSGDGGGIFCLGSSAIIEKNTITQNTTSARGGGIGCESSSPCIEGNEIHGNQALKGGGISCLCSSPKLLNNILYENCAECGGGILAESISSPVVTNNAFYANTALSTGGGIHGGSEFFTITNTILWNNDAPTDPQINGANAAITYCDVQGGWPGTGNIDAEPLFLDPGAGDFHLANDSPCLNKGDNNAPDLPACDFEGDPRVMYFIVDMGADEIYGEGYVIRVPFDVSTIQGAIDAAVDGDTVLVGSGTYFESIDFKGKAIKVKSSSGPSVTTIDGNGSYTIVSFTESEEKDSILQGFTITNGDYSGICCENSSPTINNNIISGNGIFGNWGASGGMYNYKSSPTVTNCIFTENEAGKGGGMCNNYSNPTVTNCIFSENEVTSFTGDGGGMYNDHSSPTVTNCTFTGNSADGDGGGMYSSKSSSTVTNCTFYGNSANLAGGGIYNEYSNPTVTNCILWNDTSDEIYTHNSSPTVTYSCIQGGYAGTGNIDTNPLFFEPANDDYHLTWLSPCINRGTNDGAPSDDFDGDPRPYMGTVDMGADEFVGLHPLEADTFSVPEAGGTVNFSLKADQGNRKYLIVGGLSGTAPGTPLPGGYETLRVNWDWFSDLEMTLLNTYIFSNFASTLDAQGMGTAQLNLPSVPGAAGIKMHYAYCCNNPFDFVSNPVVVEIVP